MGVDKGNLQVIDVGVIILENCPITNIILNLLVYSVVCVCVCFLRFVLDIKFVGRTSRGHTGRRSHRISHPPSFCGARLNFSREKDSAIPFPRRSQSRVL